MNFKLLNPRHDISDVSIQESIGGKFLLYLKWSWMAEAKAVDDYLFSSPAAAKRYYATRYQSIKHGCQKPKWIKGE